ncbi:MAG: hypothetical protein ACRCTD_12040 [Beijerinckiaceae bacterium]
MNSPAAKKLDFWLGPIHVDHQGLTAVAESMMPRWKGERGVGVVLEKQRPGVEASYRIVSNMLSFAIGFDFKTPKARATVIHEMVHAMHDTLGARHNSSDRGGRMQTKESENEAAAYVADALFSLFEEQPAPKPAAYNADKTIAQASYAIAMAIKDTPGVKVDTSMAAELRVAIMKDPVYKAIRHDPMTRSRG